MKIQILYLSLTIFLLSGCGWTRYGEPSTYVIGNSELFITRIRIDDFTYKLYFNDTKKNTYEDYMVITDCTHVGNVRIRFSYLLKNPKEITIDYDPYWDVTIDTIVSNRYRFITSPVMDLAYEKARYDDAKIGKHDNFDKDYMVRNLKWVDSIRHRSSSVLIGTNDYIKGFYYRRDGHDGEEAKLISN